MEPRVTGDQRKTQTKTVRVWQRRSVFSGAVAVLIVIIGTALWNFYWHAPKFEPASVNKMTFPLPDKPSIAVLPFDNISSDREQDYIADGITENIIAYLSKHPAIFVIDRKSSFTYKGKHVKVQQVSEDLGVRLILEGSVQKSGNRLRVTAQLVDALKGYPLWSERYDRDFQELFAVQDEITTDIQKAMGLQLTGEHIVNLYGTTNIEAWGYMVREITLANQPNKENILEARTLCEKAAKLDPSYGYAWNQLAWTYVTEAWFGGWTLSPAEALKRAMEYAQKEEATGKARGGYHTLMNVLYVLQGKYDDALAEGEKAIGMEPNAAVHYARLATALRYAGRPAESIPNSKKAMRLNPYYPAWYLFDLGAAYEMGGQYSEALQTCNKLLERSLKGEFPPLEVHEYLAITYARLGQMEKARAHADEILKINPKYATESFRRNTPYKDRAYLDSLVSLLVKAGLPDKPPLPLPDKPSIAVLPFVNMGDDKSQEYFSDGLTEEIITALSKTPKLFVIARNSTFVYKGKPVNVQQVSRELGVKYVLEGSVRRSDDKLRITAQLIDAATGNHLWAERYDRELKEIFAIQDEVTLKVLTAIRVKLKEGELSLGYGKYYEGKQGLDCYLKIMEGNDLVFRHNTKDNNLARRIAEEALAMCPEVPMVYLLMAYVHSNDYWFGSTGSPQESVEKAIELVQKALTLDDTLAEAHSLLGYLYTQKKEYEKGIAEGERAVSLNSGLAAVLGYYGFSLSVAGRAEEAIPLIEKAIRLNPFGSFPSCYNALGNALMFTGRYEEAVSAYKKYIQSTPNFIWAHVTLAATYSMMGREKEAQAEAAEVLSIDPKFSLDFWAKTALVRDQSIRDKILNALRKAGLK